MLIANWPSQTKNGAGVLAHGGQLFAMFKGGDVIEMNWNFIHLKHF